MVNISFLILNAISFLHSVYFIFSKFYFILFVYHCVLADLREALVWRTRGKHYG